VVPHSDTIERMNAEGIINMSSLKLINGFPPTPEFPFLRSTSLYVAGTVPSRSACTATQLWRYSYPEWPVGVLPHVPTKVAASVASALYNIDANSTAAHSGKYV